MILATNVHYGKDGAWAAGVLFKRWPDATPLQTLRLHVPRVADYIPGQFFKRELPCLLELIAAVEVPLQAVIVGGFVTLGESRQLGLGWKVWEALDQSVSVIGVAKTSFAGTPDETHGYWGKSRSPLYVTAAGMKLEEAKAAIQMIYRPYCLPTLLEQVDQLARQ